MSSIDYRCFALYASNCTRQCYDCVACGEKFFINITRCCDVQLAAYCFIVTRVVVVRSICSQHYYAS